MQLMTGLLDYQLEYDAPGLTILRTFPRTIFRWFSEPFQRPQPWSSTISPALGASPDTVVLPNAVPVSSHRAQRLTPGPNSSIVPTSAANGLSRRNPGRQRTSAAIIASSGRTAANASKFNRKCVPSGPSACDVVTSRQSLSTSSVRCRLKSRSCVLLICLISSSMQGTHKQPFVLVAWTAIRPL